MGSHTVTRHLTQVNTPRLNPARQAGTRFTYRGGMEGWVDLSYFFCWVTDYWQLIGFWVDSEANFGFSSKTMNKRHHYMLSLSGKKKQKTYIDSNIGLLCLIIGLLGIFPLTSPQPEYWRECVPGIPGGVDASVSGNNCSCVRIFNTYNSLSVDICSL